MTRFRFHELLPFLCIGIFCFGLMLFAEQNGTLTSTEHNNAIETVTPFKINLTVSEVRLDAVVLDKKGRPITDLTSADFEVYQDRMPQEVIDTTYVGEPSDAEAQSAIVGKKESRNLPLLPTPELTRNDVHRTIIFIVDDISMSFEYLSYTKMALKRFVERQMQPGDLIAVLKTGYGSSYLNMFLADKRQIMTRIDTAIRWSSNAGFAYGVSMGGNSIRGGHRRPDPAYAALIYQNQIASISYSIRALKDMPGRKFLLLLTAQPTIIGENSSGGENKFAAGSAVNHSGNIKLFDRLADEALRSSIVFHCMDIVGVDTFWPGAEAPDFGDNSLSGNNSSPQVNMPRNSFVDPLSSGAINPLPAKTGGLNIANSNFFFNGIGEANSLMRGYYLISYVPPPTTFKSNRKNIYHRVVIKVKRKGAVVHTRDGFYGVTETGSDTAAPGHPLQDAIFSPFRYKDLSINLASGYIEDTRAGYLLRSWLHLDAKDIKIIETVEGGLIHLEAVCLTSDTEGFIHDSRIVKYSFRVRPENLEWIRTHGIRFSLILPVKKPGSYYVRTAVRDEETGKVGSAYQFVEIPDLKKKRLALSSIFMITSEEDLDWIRSDSAKEITEGEFFPLLKKDETRNPALRSYSAGDKLRSLAMLYNADESLSRSGIEIQNIIYKDGKEFLRSPLTPIAHSGMENSDRIPLLQKVTMGSDFTQGDYVLQLLVTDTKNGKKKEEIASQTLSFEIAQE
jgi:VWFA-related protein